MDDIYKVIVASNADELNKRVNALAKEGWLAGGGHRVIHTQINGVEYSQSLSHAKNLMGLVQGLSQEAWEEAAG